MESSAGTDAIVALEDEAPDILFARVPGSDVPAWPILRTPLFAALATQELETAPVPPRAAGGGRSRARVRATVGRARRALPNPWDASAAGSAAHVFVGSGTTRGRGAGGRSANWLFDAHAGWLSPDSLILQESRFDLLTPRRDRPAFRRTLSMHRLSYEARGAAARWGSSEADFLASFAREVSARLATPLSADALEQLLPRLGVAMARKAELDGRMLRLLERIDPAIVYVQGGAYGGRSTMIEGLRRRGVRVVEHQHGWIGPAHGAYNFGAAMSDPALASTLPDTLLTFGERWSDGLRFPGEVVPVGKPHLVAAVEAADRTERRPPRLLLVSSVVERERLLDIGRRLRRLLPHDWSIALRPHPSERPTADVLFGPLEELGMELDEHLDVYDSLASSRVVVGFASTVLFEALAFGCRPVVIDSRLADLYAPLSVFPERVREESDLLALSRDIDAPGAAGDAQLVEGYWHPRPRDAFDRFTRGVGRNN